MSAEVRNYSTRRALERDTNRRLEDGWKLVGITGRFSWGLWPNKFTGLRVTCIWGK